MGQTRREARVADCFPDIALEFVFSYIDNPQDRSAISLVCKKWHDLDNHTRKNVNIACCYSANPPSLTKRFKRLEGVKLKGQPRPAMFNLLPADWGGYAEPWIREIVANCQYLKSIHLRRMVVTDEDLMKLARERGHMLQVLKLELCSGFSTNGLESIARSCRSLRVILLHESTIDDHDGKWLHELALHNSSVEVLNFSSTNLQKFEIADLETLVANCKSLTSLKMNDVELMELRSLLSKATALEELGGVLIGQNDGNNGQQNESVNLPKSLTSLVGLVYMGFDAGDNNISAAILPLATSLKKIDLQCAFLSVQGHCQLLRHCINLQELEVLNGIGDEGLEVVASNCKNLNRLRVEHGDRDDQQGIMTQRGLISIARGCPNLEYMAVHVSDINNMALIAVGQGCSKLRDFRLVLVEDTEISDFPLDDGVMALMQGCPELNRFALYLRPGLLSDRGMSYIGQFGCKVRWALLGFLGETDMGFSWFADGCPNLERLEMRGCIFSEAVIAASVLKMQKLKYIWVQGYRATSEGQDLLAMRRPFWNIEFIPGQSAQLENEGQGEEEGEKKMAQFMAYRSLAGRRIDNPETIICFA